MTLFFKCAATAAIVMAAALSGCQRPAKPAAKQVKALAEKDVAPDFELKDVNGQVVKLAEQRGKVVLLNFWATWCGPCKMEIPWFIEFQQKYKDKGFTVIGVAEDDEGWEVVKPYLEKKQVNYPVVLFTTQLEQAYGGIEALPTTFLLDRQGRVMATHVGLVTKKEYSDEIEKLLE